MQHMLVLRQTFGSLRTAKVCCALRPDDSTVDWRSTRRLRYHYDTGLACMHQDASSEAWEMEGSRCSLATQPSFITCHISSSRRQPPMLNVPEMTYHAIALFCMRLALCHHDCLGPHRLLFSLLSEQPERKEELT